MTYFRNEIFLEQKPFTPKKEVRNKFTVFGNTKQVIPTTTKLRIRFRKRDLYAEVLGLTITGREFGLLRDIVTLVPAIGGLSSLLVVAAPGWDLWLAATSRLALRQIIEMRTSEHANSVG